MYCFKRKESALFNLNENKTQMKKIHDFLLEIISTLYYFLEREPTSRSLDVI